MESKAEPLTGRIKYCKYSLKLIHIRFTKEHVRVHDPHYMVHQIISYLYFSPFSVNFTFSAFIASTIPLSADNILLCLWCISKSMSCFRVAGGKVAAYCYMQLPRGSTAFSADETMSAWMSVFFLSYESVYGL